MVTSFPGKGCPDITTVKILTSSYKISFFGVQKKRPYNHTTSNLKTILPKYLDVFVPGDNVSLFEVSINLYPNTIKD
jgi:hypothetical protein